MDKFPILKKLKKEKRDQVPLLVEYSITAKGWMATGAIKYNPSEELTFWSLLQMVVECVLAGGDKNTTVLNESYTDGFSRYLRPVGQK